MYRLYRNTGIVLLVMQHVCRFRAFVGDKLNNCGK